MPLNGSDWGGIITAAGNAASSIISASKGKYSSYIQAAEDYKKTQEYFNETNKVSGNNNILLLGGIGIIAILLLKRK